MTKMTLQNPLPSRKPLPKSSKVSYLVLQKRRQRRQKRRATAWAPKARSSEFARLASSSNEPPTKRVTKVGGTYSSGLALYR